MTIEQLVKETLNEVRGLRKELLQSKSKEVYTKTALQILGLKNPRILKDLRDLGHIVKFTKRMNGKEFLYEEAELQDVRIKIDNGTIIINQRPKNFA